MLEIEAGVCAKFEFESERVTLLQFQGRSSDWEQAENGLFLVETIREVSPPFFPCHARRDEET